MTSPRLPEANKYLELMQVSVGASVLASLAHLGVLEALCKEARTSEDIATTLGLNEPALLRSLRVAEAMGVLSRAEERWQIAPLFLDAGSRGPVTPDQIISLMLKLPEHLRSGVTYNRTREDLTRQYQASTPGLSHMFEPFARQLAEHIDRPLGSLLDVGAGAGIWSLHMACRHVGCEVTALDFAPVLAGFEANAQRMQVPYSVLDGDYHQVVFDRRFDRVVLANVLHLESPENAARLVERASAWTRPGGDVVIIDMMVRNEATALDVAVYELHLALRVPGGRVYSAETIKEWCDRAQLQNCVLHVLDDNHGGAAMVAERKS